MDWRLLPLTIKFLSTSRTQTGATAPGELPGEL